VDELNAKVGHLKLRKAIDIIKDYGNKYTHTTELNNPTESDITKIMDQLHFLYSYLFIEYFNKYEFGFKGSVMTLFSALPPFVRYKTLDFLYQQNPSNVFVIDKLVLVIQKEFSAKVAFEWLEKRKSQLKKLSSLTDDVKEARMPDFIKSFGEEGAQLFIAERPNMYDLCMDRLTKLTEVYQSGSALEKRGFLYKDFESSIDVYESWVTFNEHCPEEAEFKSIMEFLYLGRKSKLLTDDKILLTEKEIYLESLQQLNPLEQDYFNYHYKQAKADSSQSSYVLGNAYFTGQLGLEINFSEAARWFSKASRLGDEDADFHLAAMFSMGIGVKQDLKKAILFMKKALRKEKNIVSRYDVIAASERNPSYLLLMASLYYFGVGITMDEDISVNILTYLSKNYDSVTSDIARKFLDDIIS